MTDDVQVEAEPAASLMIEAEHFRSVVFNIPGIVYRSECREPWRMVFVSDYVESLLGFAPSLFLREPSMTFGDLLHPDDRNRINALLEEVLEHDASYCFEYRLFRADGGVVSVEEHGRIIRDDAGLPLWLDGVIFDVSRRKAAEDARDRAETELRHRALHDPLTGLPNRAHVLEQTEALVAKRPANDAEIAVLFIDLDDFKRINDEHGHHMGDELLRRVADRLFGAVRSSDTIGRLGGDEFIVVLEGPAVGGRAEETAWRLGEVLAEPFDLGTAGRVHVSASIGIVISTGATAEQLLDDADLALYRAKAAGRGAHVVFTSEMRAEGRSKAS